MNGRKVAIITMHRVLNAGSVLQAYALQKAISALGFTCDIVNYAYPDVWHVLHAGGCESNIGGQGLLRRVLKSLGLFTLAKRVNFTLHEFRDRRRIAKSIDCLVCTRRIYRKETIRKLSKYDVYVTGSDQVWNPRYIGGDYSFFWDFTSEAATRIAYGPSFGDKMLPDHVKNDYRKLLLRYSSLSMREKSGSAIVSQLTGKDAATVLDPTFLLNQEEWAEIADDSAAPKGSYVFAYLLDYVFKPFPAINDFLVKLHEMVKCPVIVCVGNSGIPRGIWPEGVRFVNGYLEPRAFVRLMMGAELVVSNSFHGVAFAVNFHKKFIAVLNPFPTNDDRVGEFLGDVGLSKFGVQLGGDLNEDVVDRALNECRDWGLLESRRSASRLFLKGALGV